MASYYETLREFKRQYWLGLVAEHKRRVSAIARASGTNRTHVYKSLDALGIDFRTKHYMADDEAALPLPALSVNEAMAAFTRQRLPTTATRSRLPLDQLSTIPRSRS